MSDPPESPAAVMVRDRAWRAGLIGLVSLVLSVVWRRWFATAGGDIAAQYFWADTFAAAPSSAYAFDWFGGVHVANYSVLSPPLMAAFGVVPVMIASSAVTAMLVYLVAAARLRAGALLVGTVAAVAMFWNELSGRASFALGTMFAAAALASIWARSDDREAGVRRLLVVALWSLLATFGSPLAGLLLGLVAAGHWLAGGTPGTIGIARWFTPARRQADALGVPPVAAVLGLAIVFPFTGQQPLDWTHTILPLLASAVVLLVAPKAWRTLRWTVATYAVAVLAAWLVPSQIGTNIERFALVFTPIVLAAVVGSRWGGGRDGTGPSWKDATTVGATVALVGALAWQVAHTRDDLTTEADPAWTSDLDSVVDALHDLGAARTRVEVVPTASHAEAYLLAPDFAIVRGWLRQADVSRNDLFYARADELDATSYRDWLDRWAVAWVVVAPGEPDQYAVGERELVDRGVDGLRLAWEDDDWRVYEVVEPVPIAAPDAEVVAMTPDELVLDVGTPGDVDVKVWWSPWLQVEGPAGASACVGPGVDDWTRLRVDRPGRYVISAPYRLRRSATRCD